MTAICSFCGKVFDSHDGGVYCQGCHTVFCPTCEEDKIETHLRADGLITRCPECGYILD